MERHWQAHKGTICAGVSWDAMPLPELLEIADCIGSVGLSVAFRVMAEDGAGCQGRYDVLFCLARTRVGAAQVGARTPWLLYSPSPLLFVVQPHTGGLPDLILWKPEARRAMLVEVKGPTDRLSEQQCAWMATLSAAGLQVSE